MFAVELHFDDGISPNEMIIVRRHSFVVGCSDDADVVVEGSAFAVPSIRVRRGKGGQFFAQKLGALVPEKTFEREGRMQLGNVSLVIRPLDIDFVLPPGESMDRAGLRVLRRAFSQGSPSDPVLIVRGDDTFELSLPMNEVVLIGRSRACAVRLSGPTILPEHALVRVRSDGGVQVTVEPAVPGAEILDEDGKALSGPTVLKRGKKLSLGAGAISLELLSDDAGDEAPIFAPPLEPDEVPVRFPCLVSKSDVMRPDRYPLSVGRRISIGRDPSNDVWLNVAHVSRVHAELMLREDGSIEVTDLSSNGTTLNGTRLNREEPVIISRHLAVLDFHRGIHVAICFSGKDETEYFGEKQKPRRNSSLQGQILAQIQIPLTPINSDGNDGWGEPETEFSPPPPVWRGDRSGKVLHTPQEEPEAFSGAPEAFEEAEIEKLLPQSRMGLPGKLFFYLAVLALLVFAYYQWSQIF